MHTKRKDGARIIRIKGKYRRNVEEVPGSGTVKRSQKREVRRFGAFLVKGEYVCGEREVM